MKSSKKALIFTGILFLISALIVSAVFIAKIYLASRFPNGTEISGIDVSYKTPEEAVLILEKERDRYMENKLLFKYKDLEFKTTPEELGMEIPVRATVETINERYSGQRFVSKLLSRFNSRSHNTDLIVNLDKNKLIDIVEYNFNLDELKAKEATLYFDKGELKISEEKSGFSLDEEKLIKDVKESARSLESKNISVKLNPVTPQVTAQILESQKTEIEEILKRTIVLEDPIYSDNWEIRLIDHLDWVEFKKRQQIDLRPFGLNLLIGQSDKNDRLKIKIRRDKLDKYIDENISEWLDVESSPVNIYKNEEGEVLIEGDGNDGLKVDRDSLQAAIELAIDKEVDTVPIPVIQSKPKITVAPDLEELGIVDRVAIGHTSYYGSPPNRVHNIKVGASKFNGLLIAPGEEFSFNQNLGSVGAADGYRPELVIKPEGTIPEYGGGLCQVSTTFYRAALLGGLDITQRSQHSYAVSYYSQILGDGLDATIYLGGPDFKFINDTDGYLLTQAYVKDDYELYVVFYGTPDGRSVELEGPYISNFTNAGMVYAENPDQAPGTQKQTAAPHHGFHVLWYRHLTMPDGEEVSEPIETAYRAVPGVISVGPGGGGE